MKEPYSFSCEGSTLQGYVCDPAIPAHVAVQGGYMKQIGRVLFGIAFMTAVFTILTLAWLLGVDPFEGDEE